MMRNNWRSPFKIIILLIIAGGLLIELTNIFLPIKQSNFVETILIQENLSFKEIIIRENIYPMIFFFPMNTFSIKNKWE